MAGGTPNGTMSGKSIWGCAEIPKVAGDSCDTMLPRLVLACGRNRLFRMSCPLSFVETPW